MSDKPKPYKSRWGRPSRYQLSEVEAFDAMRAFIRAFKKREEGSQGIHRLVSFTDRNEELNLEPGDPAQWEDWLAAVDEMMARKRTSK